MNAIHGKNVVILMLQCVVGSLHMFATYFKELTGCVTFAKLSNDKDRV
jgi:hypothetical protein